MSSSLSCLGERAWVEWRLALEATTREAARPIQRRALLADLLPILNAMAAAGLISIPGMMAGQILAGIAREVAEIRAGVEQVPTGMCEGTSSTRTSRSRGLRSTMQMSKSNFGVLRTSTGKWASISAHPNQEKPDKSSRSAAQGRGGTLLGSGG